MRIDFERFLANPGEALELVRRNGSALLVLHDGETYRLQLDSPPDLWAGYDPAAARRGLHAGVGALNDVDVEELLADIRAQRGQDTQGRPA
jgi:hypothetical protein